jgi:hypothetical protein
VTPNCAPIISALGSQGEEDCCRKVAALWQQFRLEPASVCVELLPALLETIATSGDAAMNNIYQAARFLSEAKQFGKCEDLLAAKEKLPVANEDQQQARDIYLGLAKIRLLFARGEEKKAHELAETIRDQVCSFSKDNFRKYLLLFDLADFETNYGDLKAAVSCYLEAKKAGAAITVDHPEAFSESIYHLSIRYRQMKKPA